MRRQVPATELTTCSRAIAKRSLKRILHCQLRRLQSLSMSLAVLDDLSADELGTKLKEYSITATDTKNPLSDPYPFNLMFQTSIGPSGPSPGYMRPETAQGIFVNFKDLYYYNGNKLLFATAQIGQAFRNEISPCQGLLRAREFTLVEIEHFVDPEAKVLCKFVDVANMEFDVSYEGANDKGNNKTYDPCEAVSKEKSGVPLVAHEKFSEPREVEVMSEKEAWEMKEVIDEEYVHP